MPAADGSRVRAQQVDAVVIPQFTLAVEHYNRICRLLAKGMPVRMRLELRARYLTETLDSQNVVAEIPGADPRIGDEVVMFGAHVDSWHTGTGSSDNGCGSAVVIEAARLIAEHVKQSGQRPRRTIRPALWSGEEQGLLGSRAWVAQELGSKEAPKAAHGKIAGYFNLDNGTGRIRGVYLQGNEAVAPIFRAWLRPFHTMGASTLTLDDTGGTDHLAFHAVGLPGFQFIQDPVSYSTRTHHSNMDNWDHAVAEDLQQAAVIMASFVWHTAQRDDKLPTAGLR
jgi:Zn-dependent M28 family amino/carboxypeptidase